MFDEIEGDRDGIDTIEFEAARILFLSDIFAAVDVVVS